jgi:NAD(P)-dependent dehydrogenase (short-subunit alcohol dehydrogenase family)
MSNFSSKGTALIAGASRSIGAVYANRLAKRTTSFWFPATRRDSGRSPRASSVTRVLGSKSFEPI